MTIDSPHFPVVSSVSLGKASLLTLPNGVLSIQDIDSQRFRQLLSLKTDEDRMTPDALLRSQTSLMIQLMEVETSAKIAGLLGQSMNRLINFQ